MKNASRARDVERASILTASTTRPRRSLRRAVCGALVAALSLAPGVAPADDAAYRPSEVERAELPHVHRLPNGLTVLIAPSRRAPRVAMELRYDAGSRRESPDHPGVARLALRALLDGGAHTRGYATRVANLGTAERASFSGFDEAGFNVVVAPDAMESVLWMWSDQMGFGRASISEEALARDRASLAASRDRVEATRGGCIDDVIDAALFPAPHPYASPAVATRRVLDAVTVGDVQAFYDRHFTPGGANLTIVGDVDETAALALATRYFGDVPAAPALSEPAPPAVHLDGETSIDVVSAGEGPAEVILAWPTAGLTQADDTALDVLSELLAGERWADLGYALVTARKLATRVEARQRSRALGSVYGIRVVGRAGVRDRDLVSAVDDVLRDIGAHVTAHGLKSAVSDMIRRALAQSESASHRADRLGMYAATANDPAFFPKLVRRLMILTPASIVDTVRRQLPLDRRLVAHISHAAGAPVCGARVSTTSGSSAGAR